MKWVKRIVFFTVRLHFLHWVRNDKLYAQEIFFKDTEEIKKLWENKLGGDFRVLQKAITKGILYGK